jgi:hypothetical protein
MFKFTRHPTAGYTATIRSSGEQFNVARQGSTWVAWRRGHALALAPTRTAASARLAEILASI